MEKRDPRKELKHLYAPSPKEVVEVDVPPMKYLSLEGTGAPESEAYAAAVEALFTLSYAIKFAVKNEEGVDYRVMPLEGLWWTDSDEESFESVRASRDAWRWNAMISQPDLVTDEHFERTLASVAAKKELPALSKIRFGTFHEGRAAQILHVGPFSEEWPNIERVHRFIEERGKTPAGRHHEIYLTDFRRAAPENLKTVLRQPFTD